MLGVEIESIEYMIRKMEERVNNFEQVGYELDQVVEEFCEGTFLPNALTQEFADECKGYYSEWQKEIEFLRVYISKMKQCADEFHSLVCAAPKKFI